MGGIAWNLKIVGAEKLEKKLSAELFKTPLAQAIKKATLFLEREVKKNTPVDTGRLRSGITNQIAPDFGIVGTNVKYASFVEYGSKPHWPPIAPLEAWASRHGMKGAGYAIARKIAAKGTAARQMFGKGFTALQGKIGEFVKDCGEAISVKWGE